MQSTWLDRAIGWASPARGARRVQARRMMSTLGYEGAQSGRRTDGWVTTSSSADAEADSSNRKLRDRARDLVRNNPYAARAIDVKVSNTIGTGIVAEVKNRRLAASWAAFVDGCDADAKLDLYGLQTLIERCRMESGEALVQFVPSSQIPGSVAVKLRVLEPDYLDETKDGRIAENGNMVRRGIEYGALGQVLAYWIYNEHPGDSWSSMNRSMARGLTSRRVVAEDIIHVFRKLRPGQTRGVTDFAPVMMRMRDLDDYDDAELMRKKIEACLAAFVTTGSGMDSTMLGPVSTDAQGRIETLFPGMIEYLKPGESITMADPKSSGGYADFERFGLRAISAGCGVPYELMTGDLSQVNYSSYRAGLVDFRRRIEQDQWQLHVPTVCQRIWNRFQAEAAFGSPGIGERTKIEWTPPRFELIDPLKETEAEIEACLAGFDTWPEIVRKRGWTSTEQLDAIEDWQKELDKRGIVLKSDARTTIAAKAAATPAAPDKPADSEDDSADAAPEPDKKQTQQSFALGPRVVRKFIERDADGLIVSIREEVAA
jgi:lambda family phage portal protein